MAAEITGEEALAWLRQVEGQLFRSETQTGERAWVAVVPVPGSAVGNGKLIIALGDTMLEAAAAAEDQWQSVWSTLSREH